MNPERRRAMFGTLERMGALEDQIFALQEVRVAQAVEVRSLRGRLEAVRKECEELSERIEFTRRRIAEIVDETVTTRGQVEILVAQERSSRRRVRRQLDEIDSLERNLAVWREEELEARDEWQRTVGAVVRLDYKLRRKVIVP